MAKIIQDDTLQGIINYLLTRPYGEVYQVMPTLVQLPTYPEPEATQAPITPTE